MSIPDAPVAKGMVYWTASKIGGRTIVLMPINLPEEEDGKARVLTAFVKSGYLVTRIEKFYDGRIVKTKGL